MIEMLGVLAIIGILSAGGIMGYSKAMENHQTNKLIDGMENVLAGSLGLNLNVGEVIRIPALKQLGIIPTGFADETKPANTSSIFFKTPQGFWADLYILRLDRYRLYFWSRFSYRGSDTSMSFNTCVKLVTRDWGQYTQNKDLYLVSYISFYRSGTYTSFTLPMSVQDAQRECSTTTGNDQFTLHIPFEAK